MKRKIASLLAFVLVLCTCMNAMAASYSIKWTQSADKNWQAYKNGVKLTSTWVMDDECDVAEGLYYLVDENGNLVTSQLVHDGEGRYYTFNDVHDGHFGAMRTANGVYNGVNLVFEQTHNGGYGSILNADGIAALAAKYGVKEMPNIKNSAVVVLSEVKQASSDSGDVPTTYYTVKYQMNGYGATPSDARVQAGSRLTAPATPSDATGKMEFSSWYKDSELSTVWNFAKDTVASDLTLFAKWVIAGIKVTGITLDTTTVTMKVGENYELLADVIPEDATCKALEWTTSDAAVVSIVPDTEVSGCVLTALKAGTAEITATAADGSGKKATCVVTVSNTPPLPAVIKVTGITLNKTALELETGESDTLTATVAPENATNKILQWSSSAAAVASVDQTGKVTAVSDGTAVITAAATDGSGITATCTVTVTAAQYLTFTAEEDGSTVKFKYKSGTEVKYSFDGTTWVDCAAALDTNGTTINLVNAGDTVYFKGNQVKTDNDNHFSMTGKIIASGDVTSLTNGTGGNATLTTLCYQAMFAGCASLAEAPSLPSKTLATGCYAGMFYDCTGLTEAPSLPAMTLAKECYSEMFEDCKNLTTVPDLPATTLKTMCYANMFDGCTGLVTAPAIKAATMTTESCYGMFFGCTSLTTVPDFVATTMGKESCYEMFRDCTSLAIAPALPATTLGTHCYDSMFDGCVGLTNAPALPATALKEACYSCMFSGCTALTEVPDLPATVLAKECYSSMFYECSSLTEAPIIAADTMAEYACSEMFEGCSALKVDKISSGGVKFFTCPSLGTFESTVFWMFKGTYYSPTTDPVEGESYYYHLDD